MDENTNVEINDVSNTTGNIGQNESADSLFQPVQGTGSSLDLTFIDNALTPVRTETEDRPQSSTKARELQGYTNYMGAARVAGGDGDSGDDDDNGHDNETISEGIERSRRETERMNERTRKENESREREREAKERAERARERAEKESKRERASDRGNNDNTPGGAGSGSGSPGGSEYDNGFISESEIAASEDLTNAEVTSAKAHSEVITAKQEFDKATDNANAAIDRYNQAAAEASKAKEEYNNAIAAVNARTETIDFMSDQLAGTIKERVFGGSSVISNIDTAGDNVTIIIDSAAASSSSHVTVELAKDGRITLTETTTNRWGKESEPRTTTYSSMDEFTDAVGERRGIAYDLIDDQLAAINEIQDAIVQKFNAEMAAAANEKIAQEADQKLAAAEQEARQAIAQQTAAGKVLDNAISASEKASSEFDKAIEAYNEAIGASMADTSAAGENAANATAEANKQLQDGLNSGGGETTPDVAEDIKQTLNGTNGDNDVFEGTIIGIIKDDIERIRAGFESEADGTAYANMTSQFVDRLVSTITSGQLSWFQKLSGIFTSFKDWLNNLRETFYSRKEGKIVDFIRQNINLGIRVALALLTGGGSVAAELMLDMGRIMWNSLRNWIRGDLVNAGWELDGLDSDGSGEAFWNDVITVTDPDYIALNDPFANVYSSDKVNKNYSDYNYGLEGKQKGQLYSDKDIKSFITTVVRKSPVSKYITNL